MQPSWHDEAVKEFCASSVYYAEKSEGLGERFIDELESTVTRILIAPESLRVFRRDCRKMNLRSFPYSVIYIVRSGRVHIVAVAHQKRKPNYWVKRAD